MKQGNLEKWNDIESCKNLLFFSELVNEQLFDYSIPSNRIATLNSHFLCFDALSAIDGIEEHGVPEGTLKPIVEELYASLQKDPAFDFEKDSPLKYFVKYQNEKYRISTNVSELNYEELKKATFALNTRFFKNRQYYDALKGKIIDLVIKNQESDQPCLFRLTKSLLTELVNLGYSQSFIYKVMNDLFWKPDCQIDTPECINDFFSYFTFEKSNYTVVFIVNRAKISKFTNYIEDLSCVEQFEPKTTLHAEKQFLSKGSNQSFLVIERKSYDPFSAAEAAKTMLSINTAFYRLCDHDYRYDINSAKCGVYSGDDFFRIEREKSAVAHTKMPSNRQISESMLASEKALASVSNRESFRDYLAMINVALFHAQSLDSTSAENQLLDLWAIFEAVLDISNKHTSDRIIQVCMYLVPILKRRYVYSLFSQLANDIKNYSESRYNEIIGECTTETEIIQTICEFVVLDENKTDRDAFLTSCADFPLLKERIEYYTQVFEKPNSVYQFVEKHAERVKWQVMRIYRNRNLIIHNGDSMPYLNLLIENLHSYADDFLNYTIHSLSKGHNVNSMCQDLFAKECEWLSDFSSKKGTMNHNAVAKMLSM